MPLVYADSSVLFAYLHRYDEFSYALDLAVQEESPDCITGRFFGLKSVTICE